MAGFKELKVWQLGIELTREVYALTSSFPASELYGLTNQLRRCTVSIPSNIAEGHARNSSRELARYVSIARGSLAELETQLIISKELGFGDERKIDYLLGLVAEEGRMLTGFYRSITSESRKVSN